MYFSYIFVIVFKKRDKKAKSKKRTNEHFYFPRKRIYEVKLEENTNISSHGRLMLETDNSYKYTGCVFFLKKNIFFWVTEISYQEKL